MSPPSRSFHPCWEVKVMGGKRERKPRVRDFTVLTSQVAPPATSEGRKGERSASRPGSRRFPSGPRTFTSGRVQVRVGSPIVTMGALLCECEGVSVCFQVTDSLCFPPPSPGCRSLEDVPLRPRRAAAGELSPTHGSLGPTAAAAVNRREQARLQPLAGLRGSAALRCPASPPRGRSGDWAAAAPGPAGRPRGAELLPRVSASWCRRAARLPSSWRGSSGSRQRLLEIPAGRAGGERRALRGCLEPSLTPRCAGTVRRPRCSARWCCGNAWRGRDNGELGARRSHARPRRTARPARWYLAPGPPAPSRGPPGEERERAPSFCAERLLSSILCCPNRWTFSVSAVSARRRCGWELCHSWSWQL